MVLLSWPVEMPPDTRHEANLMIDKDERCVLRSVAVRRDGLEYSLQSPFE